MKQLIVKSRSAASVVSKSINSLYETADLTDSRWQKTGVAVVGGQTDPDAGITAFRITATAPNGRLSQSVAHKFSRENFSIYARREFGVGVVSISVDQKTFTPIAVGAGWARFDVDEATSNSIVTVNIAADGDIIDVWHPQLAEGNAPVDYVENIGAPYLIAPITDGDYPSVTTRGAVFMDGFFFVMNPAGEIYQSGLEDAFTWSALDFIKSQNDPSDGVFLAKIQNYIVALKEWAVEFFYNAGNPVGSVLSPVQNMTVQLGCASDFSVQEISGGLVWMSQTRMGAGRSIVSMFGTSPEKISSAAVESILNSSDLSQVASWAAQVGPHVLYGLSLFDVNIALVYDFSTKLWSYVSVSAPVGGSFSFISYSNDRVYPVGEFTDGDLVKLSDSFGNSITVLVTDLRVEPNFPFQSFAVPAGRFHLDTSNVTMVKYVQMAMDVVHSIQSNGHQFLQRKGDGGLYELSSETFNDSGTPIKSMIVTGRIDDGSNRIKTMGSLTIIGSKIDSEAYLRWSDDDYQTKSKYRYVDLDNRNPQFRRLGSFRRRSFETTHVADTQFRVGAIDIE